jgi:hypothetical protein
MRMIIFVCISLFSSLQLLAQKQSDTIEVIKGFGPVFRQNGKDLRPRQLLEIAKTNHDASLEMQKAIINHDWGAIYGGCGGFLVGWPLGTSLAGGKANWALAYMGGALIIISIPLSAAYAKHAQSAVKIYNDGLKKTESFNPDLKLGLTNSGLCLNLRF